MILGKHQELLTELVQRRDRAHAAVLGGDVRPVETVSGTVDGGPALLVENKSTETQSVGIEVRVGAEGEATRNFAISATADEQGGIGVLSHGDYGVVGQSPDNVGVMGFGTTGVFGLSNDPEGRGVEGHATSESGIGVLASSPDATITALAINNGSIRIMDAGENTPTPVFVHTASELNTRANHTVIDHPMTNGDPRAMLIVTRRATLPSNQNVTQPQPEAYAVGFSTRANKWLIVQAEGTTLPLGTGFNVLVFKV